MGEPLVLHELLLTLRRHAVSALLIGGIRRWQWRLSRNGTASTALHTIRVTGLTAVFARRYDGIDRLLNRRSMAIGIDIIIGVLVQITNETRRHRHTARRVSIDRWFTILVAR